MIVLRALGSAASHGHARERIQKVRGDDVDPDVARRIEALLGVGGGEDLTVLETVGAPEHSDWRAVRESERRGEVVAVAAVRQVGQSVDLDRARGRLEADAEAQREVPEGRSMCRRHSTASATAESPDGASRLTV